MFGTLKEILEEVPEDREVFYLHFVLLLELEVTSEVV